MKEIEKDIIISAYYEGKDYVTTTDIKQDYPRITNNRRIIYYFDKLSGNIDGVSSESVFGRTWTPESRPDERNKPRRFQLTEAGEEKAKELLAGNDISPQGLHERVERVEQKVEDVDPLLRNYANIRDELQALRRDVDLLIDHRQQSE